ncbi:MAG TPA: choice-of-anchor D domain-containing protein [Rhizomicrobium sp.]|nr:choice-of-anchor D domain-containing protein [Rhizomicrobium sp.]
MSRFGRVFVALTAVMLFAGATPASALTKVVTVYAKKLWKNTLISVHAGDVVTISATAKWRWTSDMPFVGADGDPTDDYNALDLFQPFDFFSQARLIAYIGSDPRQGHPNDGNFFPQQSGYISVGSGQTFIAPYTGKLWLGFNDGAVLSSNGDNKGSAKATVTVGGPGTTGPSITINAPARVYQKGDSVLAGYSCSSSEATVVTCAGPAANGAAIDTSVVGHHAFTVVATDSNGNTSSQTVGYVVTDNASAAIAPTGGTFEPTFVGQRSLVHIFTLVNPLSSGITVNGVSLGASYNGGFSLYGTTCGGTLMAHHSCLIKVQFKPTASGVDRSEIDVDASVPITAVPLWAYATQVSTAQSALTFGDQGTGTTSAPQTIVLTNAQVVPLTIATLGVTGDFAIDPSTTCRTGVKKQLAMGASCNIAVTFKPTDTGTRTGGLTVHGSATVSPYSVSLSGNGVP